MRMGLGFTMSPEWAAAAANGVSCWDYPAGVAVWVPGPFGWTPVGTPATGPQCWGPPPVIAPPPAPAQIAPAPAPVPQLPQLTPANISQPLPDITATVLPAAFSMPSCWCALNEAILEHPLMAAAGLALLAAVVIRKKQR